MTQKRSVARTVARVALGLTLVAVGITHLTVARKDFQAQVPDWVPFDKDAVVLASGAVEITLGTALTVLSKHQKAVGTVAALFLTAVFPGNISQWVNGRDAFGLDNDRKRAVRLLFQPLLVAWALWSTRRR
ncbi:hypothetical protein N1027_04355 [Herbiconiux sp. CPCC 205763]|uniref:DoxX family membrane protein n=1 Tax=Herbiconiux aconitum TaxID=2970913 RepID=A0ABT2GMB2_9MICO|nr:hypothetical protein [Herbiconiux aconitum]MCS5717365.1 hypothetical protein [Herbiconiux aconitum]